MYTITYLDNSINSSPVCPYSKISTEVERESDFQATLIVTWQSWDTRPRLPILKPVHASLTPDWFLLMAFSSRLNKLSPPSPFLSFSFFLSNLPFLFTCLMRSGDNLIRIVFYENILPGECLLKLTELACQVDAGATEIAFLVRFSPTSARQKGASSWMLTSRKQGYPSNLSWEPPVKSCGPINFSPLAQVLCFLGKKSALKHVLCTCSELHCIANWAISEPYSYLKISCFIFFSCIVEHGWLTVLC